MKTKTEFSVQDANWATHSDELYAVRRIVFVKEQGVPEDMEQDEFDAVSWHVLARDRQGLPIATGRLLKDGHIGRLAVLKSWRGRGVGKALMSHLLALACRQGFKEVELNAQTQALDFYVGLGFAAEGEEFPEAGIPHRKMRRRLKTDTGVPQ